MKLSRDQRAALLALAAAGGRARPRPEGAEQVEAEIVRMRGED